MIAKKSDEKKKQVKLFLSQYAAKFQIFLEKYIIPQIQRETSAQLADSICYVLTAPAKRVRPALVFMCAGIDFEGKKNESKNASIIAAYYIATAIELIHTYSLIHDDLPAMDNDDLRRGQPTCHVKYGEWMAILTGDALNTLAFELLAYAAEKDSNLDLKAILLSLAKNAGLGGMIKGQAIDLESEKKNFLQSQNQNKKEKLLNEIHLNKTAALFSSSCELGALIAKDKDIILYREYGCKLGLLFQITDDLLDIKGDVALMGKSAKKDINKISYPNVFGVEKSIQKCSLLQEELQGLALSLDAKFQERQKNSEYEKIFTQLIYFVSERDF